MNNFNIIRELPKLDLHCHLSGSIRPGTILEIAKLEGIPHHTDDLEEFKGYVQAPSKCKSLKEYLERFELTLSVMQKKEYLKRIAYELIEDVSKQNVLYLEIRFAPYFHLNEGITFDQAVEAVLAGMEEGRRDFGVLSNLILILMRHHSPERSIEVVELGRKFLGKGVVAIDLAGNEHDFPPEQHREAFQLAKEYGFHRTVHAGETGIPENIISAVRDLHAERIGHGVHAYRDREVYEFVRENMIPLELCVTSNIQTKAIESYGDHPIRKYLEDGVVVTANTDNMTVSNTDLNQEYEKLVSEVGFSLEDLGRVILNGLEVSFASDEDKEHLRKLFNEKLDTLLLK
ncbi:MAG: adenosine deaminase [Gudongella sp.]|nr:adenosine deaminase [Gudongella sp.]